MERCKKKNIISLLKTMMEANEIVVNALPTAPEELTEVFVQCQEAALQIGTYLETFGEVYRPIVAELEDYCEKIYQMSVATLNVNVCRKLAKKTRKQLSGLQNRIQYELPEDRKEVIFLPYKASMWDSLESVWRAADEDENTDAYVIPIPYYDKNTDGSFREEHYEGELYPEYVPITRYEEYDFENRRPDMIFIHNPYDESNYVTSVHPFFYSGNLKKFTDELIYIPYFVLGEPDVGNEEDLEGIKHFCITTGVFNADKVIVQSENMKKAYVKVLTDFMKEHSGDDTKEYWEKKILGLGSPKMDKVMAARKEDVAVPEEWLNVIKKPDGSWKKIIFYNTSIQALLEHNEKMNEKIRNVLQVFKENQEEVALLWRPHPLIEATIRSVRPRLWEDYKEIVDTYRSEGWGIYDDTADLDRAIVLSDAYYGDGSSVVQLFCALNKFILLQYIEDKMEVRTDSMSVIPRAISGKEYDKYILDYADNYLYKDCGGGECEFISDIERGEGCNGFEYEEIVKLGDDIIIIPNYSKSFLIYNAEKKYIRHIYVDKKLYENNINKPGFHKIIPYKNKIFIIKYICNAIACIDKNTLEVTYTNIFDDSEQEWNLFKTAGDCYSYGSLLYIPLMDTNTFIVFDMENGTHEVKQLHEAIKIATICGCGDEMHLVEMSGKKVYTLSLSRWKIDRKSVV